MFNLETAIAEWRRQMTAAGIKTPVPLEELENHLREEIEFQMRAGTNRERAFKTAVQKIGAAGSLHSEFKKVDAARKERARALEQNLIFIFTNLIPLALCSTVLLKPRSLSQMTLGQQMSSLAAIATFTLFVWSGRLGYRLFAVIRTKRIRDTILSLVTVPGMLWWIVFFDCILPRYDFTPGRLIVAIMWGVIMPAGLVIGLAFGIETAARKKGAMAVC